MRRSIVLLPACVLATLVANELRAEDWSPLWSTATLSQAREGLSATSAGGMVFFGGGFTQSNDTDPSNVVDIYNTSTGTWSTATLSQARGDLTSTSAGNQVFFGGGNENNGETGPYSNVVDIYNTSTGTWSTATLSVQDRKSVV